MEVEISGEVGRRRAASSALYSKRDPRWDGEVLGWWERYCGAAGNT